MIRVLLRTFFVGLKSLFVCIKPLSTFVIYPVDPGFCSFYIRSSSLQVSYGWESTHLKFIVKKWFFYTKDGKLGLRCVFHPDKDVRWKRYLFQNAKWVSSRLSYLICSLYYWGDGKFVFWNQIVTEFLEQPMSLQIYFTCVGVLTH